MTFFWIAATLMALAAAACIVWPLWAARAGGSQSGMARGATNIEIYKERQAELDKQMQDGELDADAHQAMLDELQLSLLSDTADEPQVSQAEHQGGRRLLWVCAALLPVLAVLWYWQQGASQDLVLQQEMQALESPEDAQRVISLLRNRLDKQPDNTQNWFSLARLYMELGQYADATMAYLEVVNREPEAGLVVAEMAQALFLASNNQMTPEVQRVTQRALALVPDNGTALGLAGIAAFEQQDYQAAITHWQKAMAQGRPGSPGYQALAGGVARAQAALAEAGGSAPVPQATDLPSISIDVALAEGVPTAGQTLFVYARAWQGAKMPLAIQRLSVDQLPTTVVLNDSMAMMAGTSLASAGQLEVVARLSASGSPAPQPGDWQAAQGPISLAEGSVKLALTIDSQVP